MAVDSEIIRFEDFELDRGAFELRQSGRVVRLERIPLEMLVLLAENPGRLVSREQILERIWGKDVFVDADNAINTAVRKIRQALRENPEKPRLLQTVPGKGYRFAALGAVDNQAAATSTVQTKLDKDGRDRDKGKQEKFDSAVKPHSRWPLWLTLAAALLVIAAIAVRSSSIRKITPRPRKEMLAVLPFVNLSGDPHEEYFVDGMTEEMITQLGSLDPQHLGVIARTSSMQYKSSQKSAAQIAQELGVNYLVEGSVRREGARVRVTAQLIQANDQTHIWAGNFDREQSDVIRLQSEAALSILGKIESTLPHPAQARLAAAPSVNAEAHLAYLLGLHALELRTRQSTEESITAFQRAVALDPEYAPAYAALARVYSLAPVSGTLPAQESMPKAREAAVHAIALDDSLAEAHAVLAFVKAHYEYDWPGAEREYHRALELNPNDAYTHFFYSNSYLSPLGRHDEAIAEMKKAIELDPFSAPIQSFLIRTYTWARRYDQALAQYQQCNQMFPAFALDHERLAHLYTYTYRFEEAISEDAKARELAGEDPTAVLSKENTLRRAWKSGGPTGYWKQLLEFAQMPQNPPEAYVPDYGVAILHARVGDKDKALESLEKAYAKRELAMTEIGIEPAFDSLRPDPRFQSLLHRVGLSQ